MSRPLDEQLEELEQFIADVRREVLEAERRFGGFASAHEAESVMREEFHEYVRQVRRKPDSRNLLQMRRECVQLAAMALRAGLLALEEHAARELRQRRPARTEELTDQGGADGRDNERRTGGNGQPDGERRNSEAAVSRQAHGHAVDHGHGHRRSER